MNSEGVLGMTRRRQFSWLSAVVGGAVSIACGGEEAVKPAAPAAKAEPTKAPEPTKAAVAPAAPRAAPAAAAAPVKITWFASRDTTGYTVKQVE